MEEPKFDESVKSVFTKGADGNTLKQVFTLEDVLRSQIELFLDYCKHGGHRLNIIFENNDLILQNYLKKNYKNYLITRLNYFQDVVYGVTYTQKVKDSFYQHNLVDGMKQNLSISNYLIVKSKSL